MTDHSNKRNCLQVRRIAAVAVCIILLFEQAKAAFDSDTRTIAEQWGDTADISNCFFNSVQIGENEDFLIAQSNEAQVKDSSKTSFAH